MPNQFGDSPSTYPTNIFGGGTGGTTTSPVSNVEPFLNGLLETTIISSKVGNYTLVIAGESVNSPTMTINISKRAATDAFMIGNFAPFNAPDGTALEIVWASNDFVKLRKTTANFNGTYGVTIVSAFI